MNKIKKHFEDKWSLYVLGVIVVIMTVAYGRLSEYEENNINEIHAVEYVTTLKAKDIVRISIKGNKGQELAFDKKEDGTWVYEPDETAVIQQEGPMYLAELLDEIATEYHIENPEDKSLYGLDEACPYVQVETEETCCKIYIGSYNDTVRRYYAYVDGGTDVYGVTAEVAEVLDYTLKDFLEMSE